jgi:three-Cys-motif partner protein
MVRRMPNETLWDLDDHTRAKHGILRAYIGAWLAVMGRQAIIASRRYGSPARLLIVDGFAGPGRYSTGEEGSPLILLNELLGHADAEKLQGAEFIYLFIESDHDRVAHLKGELEAIEIPDHVTCHVEEGTFEEKFGEIVDEIHEKDSSLIPTFAFVDPFGYSFTPMSLAGKFLDFQRCEALFFLPMVDIARFVSRDGQDDALNSLFGTERWKEAIDLRGEERRAFLLSLFEEQLREDGRVQHVRSFEIRTDRGREYRLVFASDHDKGLALMKRAMWSVDPTEGMRFVAARKKDGQEVLFTPDANAVDTGPLLEHLRERFGTDWFTIEQAEHETLVNTPYLHDGHLKRKTLAPARKAEEIEVVNPPGRSGFVAGTRIRFFD